MARTDSQTRVLWCGMVLVAACVAAAAHPLPQAPAQGPDAFDTVTIRVNNLPAGSRYIRWMPGRVEIRGMTLRDLMRFVYGASKFPSPTQFVGGPAWLGSQRFDVDALGKGDYMKVEQGSSTPPPALQRAMQAMLESRFKLQAKPGMQELEYYVLTRAKADALGPQLRPRATCVPQQPGVAPDPAQTCNIFNAGQGVLTARAVPIDQLVVSLGDFPAIARLVRNETGLAGLYDIDVSWVPELINLGGKQIPNPNAKAGLNLPAAFEQQLGLKLERRKGPVDVIVIEQAEMP